MVAGIGMVIKNDKLPKDLRDKTFEAP
jgi:hypothetical protein